MNKLTFNSISGEAAEIKIILTDTKGETVDIFVNGHKLPNVIKYEVDIATWGKLPLVSFSIVPTEIKFPKGQVTVE